MAIQLWPEHTGFSMLRLDYISCFLTIASTILVGRRLWHGWIVAGVNSLIICFIGIKTGQTGFIPANLFCLAVYAYNITQWRTPQSSSNNSKDAVDGTSPDVVRLRSVQPIKVSERRNVAIPADDSPELLRQRGGRSAIYEGTPVLSR